METKIIKAYGAKEATYHEIRLDKLKELILERGGKEDTFEVLIDSYKSLVKHAFSELEKNGENTEKSETGK
jgi:hypothetical protein